MISSPWKVCAEPLTSSADLSQFYGKLNKKITLRIRVLYVQLGEIMLLLWAESILRSIKRCRNSAFGRETI